MSRFSDILKTVKNGIGKHSPEILTGLGVAGFVSATVLSVKATAKAMKLLEEAKELKGEEPLSPMEVTKAAWKCYIPTAATIVISGICVISGLNINLKRNAAIASIAAIGENAFREYQSKVIETIGEKKEQAIQSALGKEHIEKDPPPKTTDEVVGKIWIRDRESGDYIYDYIENVRKCMNDLNWDINHNNESYVSLADFRDAVGFKIREDDYYRGWNVSKGLVDIDFTYTDDPDGRRIAELYHKNRPVSDYQIF